jgi:hypothetical protein
MNKLLLLFSFLLIISTISVVGYLLSKPDLSENIILIKDIILLYQGYILVVTSIFIKQYVNSKIKQQIYCVLIFLWYTLSCIFWYLYTNNKDFWLVFILSNLCLGLIVIDIILEKYNNGGYIFRNQNNINQQNIILYCISTRRKHNISFGIYSRTTKS